MATNNKKTPNDFEITVMSSPGPRPRPPPPFEAASSPAATESTSSTTTATRRTSVSSPRGASSSSSSRPASTAPPRGIPETAMYSDFLSPFKRHFTWMVPGFVVANIVLFVITMYENNCPQTSATGCLGAKFLGRFSFLPLKDNPLLGPSSPALDKMGALTVAKVVTQHQVWRLLTCIWLHGGVFHVLANMLSLLFIGIRLEQEFGFVRIGFLYVLSGFGGSLTSALFIQEGISVGASGALFGLLGAMLSELFTNWTIYANKLAALLTLIVIISINLAVGILPKVDNFAHIGGFLSGFLLGFVLLIRPQFGWISQKKAPPGYMINCVKSKHKPYQYVFWVISLILLIAGYTVGLILLLRGGNMNNHCSWCRYLSCVPTPWWNCKAQQLYCQSSQMGSQLNMTCTSNGKSKTYTMPGDKQFDLQQLCSQLCS